MVPSENMCKRGVVEPYLEMMDRHMENYSIQSIFLDYGSTDETREIAKRHKSEYIYIEPNEGESCNIPKCFNKGILHARHNIIAPINIDFRFDGDLIEGIVKYFLKDDDIILRIKISKPNKTGEIFSVTYAPYVLNKKHIFAFGGWDERIWGWGKEDDDIIERIKKFGKIPQRLANMIEFKYTHIWHESDWWAEFDQNRPNKNNKFVDDNLKNHSKFLKNTTWKIKNGKNSIKYK